MFSMLWRPVLAACLLCVVATLAGYGFSSLLRVKRSAIVSLFCGFILIWALTQLIAVPMILAKKSFTATFWLITGAVVPWCVYGLCECRKITLKRPEFTSLECLGAAVTILCVIGFLGINLLTQHCDGDDSRFVVNAVDILRTDTMFLTNPATGEALEIWQGELIKDVTAPWAVFIAWCAKLTGTHATVMAHTTLPLILFLVVFSIWWLLSEEFFKKEFFYRCLFIDVVILVTVYGGFSVYSEEVFMLSRIWQGKAVVASAGIPAAYLLGMWLYRRPNLWGYYVLPVVLGFSMCLMSGMGLIMSAMMFACIGLICGIAKRRLWVSLGCFAACVPSAVYYLINSMLK